MNESVPPQDVWARAAARFFTTTGILCSVLAGLKRVLLLLLVFLLTHVLKAPLLCSDDRMQLSSSQPDFAAGGWEAMLVFGQSEGQVSFSQPTKPEHMLLGSQLLATPGASQVIVKFQGWFFFFLDVCYHLSPPPPSSNFSFLCSTVAVAEISSENDPFLHHSGCWCNFVCAERHLWCSCTRFQTHLQTGKAVFFVDDHVFFLSKSGKKHRSLLNTYR